MAQPDNIFTTFILHLHPRKVQQQTLRFSLSFGLGGMTAVLFITLLVTGVMQLLSYSSHSHTAYDSILAMYSNDNLAGFIRNLHYWSANLIVILATLHLFRVFLTGALTDKRAFNWLIGILLFILLLFANFTGYLLPWDQRAYWAVTIFTSMASYIPAVGEGLVGVLRGGSAVGSATLSNFYALHIGLIPFLICLFLVYHFWLIRKSGGLITRTESLPQNNSLLTTVPHLIKREAAIGLSVLAGICLIAALWDAPLGDQANQNQSPNPAKAAWYFLGLQELLLHLHPSFAIFLIPAGIVICLAAIPFFPGSVLPAGQWFGGIRGARLALSFLVVGIVITILAIVTDDVFYRFSESSQADYAWLLRGLMPVIVYILMHYFLHRLITAQFRFTKAESVMALVMMNAGMILMLTVAGLLFRGPGMSLSFSP